MIRQVTRLKLRQMASPILITGVSVAALLAIPTDSQSAETSAGGGGRSGGSGGSGSSSSFESGKIEKELECIMKAVGGKSDKGKEFGQGFEKAWKKLSEKGVQFPSKKDREHFWSQIFHESGKLTAMSEKGNGSAAVKGGSKYKGRGPIQLTHCYNYASFARFLRAYGKGETGGELFSNKANEGGACPPSDVANDPVMTNPELEIGDKAHDREVQALSAIWWWEDNKKRRSAFRKAVESDDVEAVSKAVNGGTNGLAERKKLYSQIKSSGCVK